METGETGTALHWGSIQVRLPVIVNCECRAEGLSCGNLPRCAVVSCVCELPLVLSALLAGAGAMAMVRAMIAGWP